jgi:DinB superfamily
MPRLQLLAFTTLLAAPLFAFAQSSQPAAPQTITFAAQLNRGFQNVQRNVLEAAEKMPEANYSFKPTPEIRPFGELIAHTALTQFFNCAALKGTDAPHKDDKEDAPRTKAELMALMKESSDYCTPIFAALKDEDLPALVKVQNNQIAKGVLIAGANTHGNEMYGTIAVYLRLKGIVPPTTERQNAAKKGQ